MIRWVEIRKFLDLEDVKLEGFGRVNIFLCDDTNAPWTSKVLQAIVLPSYLKSDSNLCYIGECDVRSNLFEVKMKSNSYNISTKKNYSALYLGSPDFEILEYGNLGEFTLNELISQVYSRYVYDVAEKTICLDNFRGVGPIKALELAEFIGAYSKKQFFISSFDAGFLLTMVCKTPKRSLRVFYKTKKLNSEEIENMLDYGSDLLLNLDSILSD